MKQRYDSYKPSGIDWIGDIPSHWNIVRLAHIFNAKAGGDAKPELYSDTKDAQHPFPVYTNSLSEKQVYAYTSSSTFQSGSITVTGRGEIGHAFLRDTDFDAIIRLLVLTPRIGLCCKYFTYFIDGVMEFFSDSAAVSQLSAQQINKELVILPPLSEQQAIADYLDAKCAEIDAAIAKVDREIELIDELKQSEISRVVTRGLNPDAPLRPSGIDWIGNIPKHWKIEKGKYLLQILPGFPADSNLFVQDDDAFPLIRIRDIDSDTTEINYSGEVPENYIITKGDILVGMDGDFNIAQWKGPNALLNQRVCKISGTNKVLGKYAFYVLPKLLKRINDVTYATTVKHLSTYDILNSKLPVPLYSEQQAIADYLDAKCAEIDGLKAKLTKKRETLTELRQSIISEVVTGKRKII